MNRLIVAPIYHFYSNYRNPFPKTVQLGNGYEIKEFKFEQVLDALDFFNDSFSEEGLRELRNCKYAIYYKYEIDKNENKVPEEIFHEINRIIQAMRIVRPTRAVVAIFNFRLANRKKDATQIIHKPTPISLPRYPMGTQHFIKEDASKIRKYLVKIRELYQEHGGQYQRVLNALIFFEIGHQNHLYKQRFISLITCLESLFNTSSNQIGYSLRIRCSYFLEKNPTDRIKLSQDLKKIYKLRSSFVHGQATEKKIRSNEREQMRLLTLCEAISRRCLTKIFDKNLTDLFSNKKVLDQEFEKLELGSTSSLC